MRYAELVLSRLPSALIPCDNIDFDSQVEDIVTFEVSDPTDATLVNVGGIVNSQFSVDTLAEPIVFQFNPGIVASVVLTVKPANVTQLIIDVGGVEVNANAVGDGMSVTALGQTTPELDTDKWYHLICDGTDWHVLELSLSDDDGLLLQFVAMFDYVVDSQDIADLENMATDGRLHLDIDSGESFEIVDLGATGLRAEWHIVSVE